MSGLFNTACVHLPILLLLICPYWHRLSRIVLSVSEKCVQSEFFSGLGTYFTVITYISPSVDRFNGCNLEAL